MTANQDRSHLRGHWLTPVRLVVFLLGTAISLLAIATNFLTVQNVLSRPGIVLPDAGTWTSAQLQRALEGLRLPADFFGFYSLGLGILFSLVFLVSGWLIMWRKSWDWYGLFLGTILLGWSMNLGITAEMPPLPAWIDEIQTYLSWFLWPGLFLQLYYFPSGHIMPRWARWFAGMLWGLFLFGLAINLFNIELPNFLFALPFIITTLLVGGFSQVYRYRHAGLVEQQQVKWVILSLLVFIGFFIGISLLINLTGLTNPAVVGPPRALVAHMIFMSAYLVSFTGLPVSIVVAILRYRLWDIDVIIRRTVIWGVITGLLGLVYFGTVTFLQSGFIAVSGQHSTVAMVISTLTIAAIFNPLRKRVQEFVDRRFYRRKYDAEQALASFAALAREEVDLEEICARLLAVVDDTMQPESVGLWLKEDRRAK